MRTFDAIIRWFLREKKPDALMILSDNKQSRHHITSTHGFWVIISAERSPFYTKIPIPLGHDFMM